MTEYNGLHAKTDIIGNRYGKWLVQAYSHKHPKSGNWYYHCLCDCGNQKIVKGSLMRTGKSSKCQSCSSKINGRKGLYSMSGGDLYMIRVADYVKIGHSNNVLRRLKDMESSSPFAAKLIYHGVGEGKDEEFWHTVFKHRHYKGEWFYMPLTAGNCEI